MVSRDDVRGCSTDEALQVRARAQGSTQVLSALGEVVVATGAVLAAAIHDAQQRLTIAA
jgi:hypothetical protein